MRLCLPKLQTVNKHKTHNNQSCTLDALLDFWSKCVRKCLSILHTPYTQPRRAGSVYNWFSIDQHKLFMNITPGEYSESSAGERPEICGLCQNKMSQYLSGQCLRTNRAFKWILMHAEANKYALYSKGSIYSIIFSCWLCVYFCCILCQQRRNGSLGFSISLLRMLMGPVLNFPWLVWSPSGSGTQNVSCLCPPSGNPLCYTLSPRHYSDKDILKILKSIFRPLKSCPPLASLADWWLVQVLGK